MMWIIIAISALFVTWLVAIVVLLARDDNRISSDPWMRPPVTRSTAIQLAREARETDRLLDWAAELLPEPAHA